MSDSGRLNDEWEQFHDGPNASIWMQKKCLADFRALPARDQAKIEATMKDMYRTLENPSISKKKFNLDEGRHDGLQVRAFKEFQSRVYGVQGSIRAKKTFFATNCATKKKNKADQNDLVKASRIAKSAVEHVADARV